MSYYFWLGREAEAIHSREEDTHSFSEGILQWMLKCKPEADGFVTIHPKVN
jgi:hypothetical protein